MSRDTGIDGVVMDGNSLTLFQTKASATQSEMAAAMKVPLRTYEDIVSGRSQLRGVHIQAAEFALLLLALQKRNPKVLTPALTNLVLDLAKMIEKAPTDERAEETGRAHRRRGPWL